MSNIDRLFNTKSNNTCDIQSLTKTYKATSGQLIRSWANAYASERCRLDMAGAGEIRIPKDIYDKATHTLYLRYISGITVLGHRIVVGGKNYNILRVSDAGGMQHHLELILELIT